MYESISGESVLNARGKLEAAIEKAEAITAIEEPAPDMAEMPHNTAKAYRATELVGGQIPKTELYDKAESKQNTYNASEKTVQKSW